MQVAVRAWAGGGVVRDGRVALDVSPLVENGNAVPITVRVQSPMSAADHVQAIAVFNELNPQRDLLRATLGPRAGRAEVATRVRLATSQKLVALARALVFQPQLVLMDEPLGALDKQLREHMQIELKELHRQLGVTFVYVTHDQGEALTMSDRVAVFNEGVIQQLADVETLYEAPSNRFVAGFVGDNTVLSGTLQGAGADTAIQLPGGYLLPGVNVNQATLGSAVHACVRPERIVLHAPSEYPKTSAIPATVARAIYYGDHLRLMCDLGHGQEPATVKVALASSASNPHPQPGDAVLLEFPPVSTRIYAV